MRRHRLFWFLILLTCISLACNLPGQGLVNEDVQQVNSVSVTPHTGTGSFSAVVNGEANNGSHTLRCYVSTDNNGGDTKFTGSLSGHSDLYQTFGFQQSFKFTYTEPGAHALVCLLDDNAGNAWSGDFSVSDSTGDSGQPQAPASEIDVKGTGTLTNLSTQCSEPATSVLLRIAADNTWVWLNASFRGKNADCSQPDASSPDNNVTFTAGAADLANQAVTVTGCSNGGPTAQGNVSYAGGTLSGQVTCGSAWKLTMP